MQGEGATESSTRHGDGASDAGWREAVHARVAEGCAAEQEGQEGELWCSSLRPAVDTRVLTWCLDSKV